MARRFEPHRRNVRRAMHDERLSLAARLAETKHLVSELDDGARDVAHGYSARRLGPLRTAMRMAVERERAVRFVDHFAEVIGAEERVDFEPLADERAWRRRVVRERHLDVARELLETLA